MTQYATAAELQAWTTLPVPDDADRRLTRAAIDIDYALQGALFAVDGNGLPTDATVIAAFRDASLAQVEWWMTIQDEVQASDTKGRIQASNQSVDTNAAMRPRLAPRAATILRLAGLLPVRVIV